MLEFIELIKGIHPGIYVHSVHIKEDLKDDQKAGWVSLQTNEWCSCAVIEYISFSLEM